VQALEAEGSHPMAFGAACACTNLRSLKLGGMCYRHNLTGLRDGPRATWAEGNHRNGLRIGFCANMSRAGMAMYLVRIV
jgi:hypothetical protein